ncbi:MAG: hypothetical protein ACM3MH_05655, partial [Actinomycetota bacterium]
MWTRLSSLLLGFLVVFALSAISAPDRAWAVICANTTTAPNNGTDYVDAANDGGSAQSTACGDAANANGGTSGHNSAYGVDSNASGTTGVNTAIGGGANASGNGAFNTATGALSN